MGKVTGVGGVFLKAQDPKRLQAWYVEHLGIPLRDGGYVSFEGPEAQGTTAFSFFPTDMEYVGEAAKRARSRSSAPRGSWARLRRTTQLI